MFFLGVGFARVLGSRALLDAVNVVTGRGPLHVAASASIVHLLADAADAWAAKCHPRSPGLGALLDASDVHGNNPLMLAAMEGREDVVVALLEHGATVNAKNRRGRAVGRECAVCSVCVGGWVSVYCV